MSAGSKVISKGMSTRQIVRCLEKNEIVAILSDQDAGRRGTFVTMFDMPTSTHGGAMKFAARTQATILPAFIHRENGPRHTAVIEDPLVLDQESDSGEVLKKGVQAFSERLEAQVRRYPDQWLWMHKRWKSNPKKTILIISDGKAGHFNQSKIIAELLRDLRTEKGFAKGDTHIQLVQITKRRGLKYLVFWLTSLFVRGECGKTFDMLKWVLDKDTYDKLAGLAPDYVISTGEHLAHINDYLSKENLAKSIIIMKPPFWKRSRFDLCLIPRHDHPRPASNIAITSGAINNVKSEIEKLNAEEVCQKHGLTHGYFTGVLIGGDNPYYTLTPELAAFFAEDLLAFAAKTRTKLLVTTSRRTPEAVETVFKGILKEKNLCPMLILPREENPQGLLKDILAMSKYVITTNDSISMVSEAASSGRPVIVYSLEAKTDRRSRHDIFIEHLRRRHFLEVCGKRKLTEIDLEKLDSLRVLDDLKDISGKLQRIV